MGFVLADEQGWLSKNTTTTASSKPFDFIPLQTFAKLREAVNDSTADFFMWEHFTSKKYYDNGSIKKIGEIYTPWSSWKIVASTSLLSSSSSTTAGGGGDDDARLKDLFEKIDQGVAYFEGHKEEAVKYIGSELDYSEEDAREWLKTVQFSSRTRGVDLGVVRKTVEVLEKAGVLNGKGMKAEEMLGKQSAAQRP